MGNTTIPIQRACQEMMDMGGMGEVGSPLLVDVNGNGVADLRGTLLPDGHVEEQGAVRFDLDGDGWHERVEWLLPGADGLLCVDLDGDGLVSSGRELFGTAHGDRDGFARLACYDIDDDGWIQARELQGLALWMDDGDGCCDPLEMYSMEELGVEAISCRPQNNTSMVRTETGTLSCWDWWPDLRP